MKELIQRAAQTLANLGLEVVVQPDKLATHTHLVHFRAETTRDGLRLEARMVAGAKPTKLNLWNLIHHNTGFLPFGQFYLSPEHSICYGCLLPAGIALDSLLDRMVIEVFRTAEAYAQQMRNDYEELPLNEQMYRPEPMHLFRTTFPVQGPPMQLTREDAVQVLAVVLGELFPEQSIHQTAALEFTLLNGDHLTTVKLENLPGPLRNASDGATWVLGLMTDAGTLERSSNRLWILLNRLNMQSFLLAYGVRYQHRKPVISLFTGLPAESLQQPEHLRLAILRQQELAAGLPALLGPDLSLKSLAVSTLGL